jgi:signal transduction histidine kinase/CheY-like chemotaxis protein
MAKVLIVDDVRVNLKLLEADLANEGYEVCCADGGPKALRLASEQRPDVILLDVMMPGMDGNEVCRRLKADPTLRHIPVIMLSAKDREEDVVGSLDAGAHDYITKPYHWSLVAARVRSAARTKESHDRLQALITELQVREGEFTALFNCAPVPMVLTDRQRCVHRVNSAAEALFGPVDGRAGLMLRDLLGCARAGSPHCDACPLGDLLERPSSPGPGHAHCSAEVEIQQRRDADPERRTFLTSTTRLQTAEGDRILLSLVDVSERKEMETRLRRAQQMESIGQLAAGIAHEINTPIQFVGDNTRFIQDSMAEILPLLDGLEQLLAAAAIGTAPQETVRQLDAQLRAADLPFLREEIPLATRQSLEGLQRVAEIVGAMKEFSYSQGREKAPTDLNQVIRSAIVVARNEYKYVADVQTDLDERLPAVHCRRSEIGRVLLNLITNAAHTIGDAIGPEAREKGTITLTTRRDGDAVEVRVRDTGTGIPEHVRKDVFVPFFTTKQVGKGTGQGLSICYAIVVDGHDGAITFETEVGEGTTFIIRLPIGEEQPGDLADAPAPAAALQ